MPDHYVQFSFEIPVTKEQADWLEKTHTTCMNIVNEEDIKSKIYEDVARRIVGSNNDADFADLSFDYNEKAKTVLVYAEELGDIPYTANLISVFLQTHNRPDTISFEWSESCSRMVADEFGGGAVALSQHAIEIKNTSDLRSELEESVMRQDPHYIRPNY